MNQGATGERGLKGDQGVGQPGKQGPRGVPGVAGSRERGARGPTGLRGQDGASVERMQRVAFTVWKTMAMDPLYSANLPFETVSFLEEGTLFNLSTGTFTCTVPGIYMFMFSLMKPGGVSLLRVYLKKNSHFVTMGNHEGAGRHQVSSGAVVSLDRDDRVYLSIHGDVDSSPMGLSSFSGCLLYEN